MVVVVIGVETGRMVCTCILHLISSIGVNKKLVNTPLAAPQKMSAFNGSLSVVLSG